MKTISTILLFLAVVSFRQISESTAKPKNIEGVDVYVYSEPSRPYDVLDRGTIAVATGCEMVIEKCAKKAAGLKADGVIVELPARFVAIKYKD